MPRPKCCRRVGGEPPCRIFKPAGIPARFLEEITLTMDEFEAIRLADFNGLYQEQAAARMNVSRQTFGRIVEEARKKVARVLVEGLALRIEGGPVDVVGERDFSCHECKHKWSVPCGTGRPETCPACRSMSISRADGKPGAGQRCRTEESGDQD
ncbi:MAG: DUF134 domain-containing protein [Desulfobacteraceae bacterium]|nr:DUF134 domain-containing protein [Desulfobacteraceae bacterium]